MTKHESIEKAQSEIFGKTFPYLKDGWIFEGDLGNVEIGIHRDKLDFKVVDYKENSVCNAYRPKSLEGIENNNGWTRIEKDESNWPKEIGWYDFRNFDKEPFADRENAVWISQNMTKIGWFMEKYTHYKKVNNLKPIY